MPRQSRIDAPGALHHIIIRGIERNKIFEDHRDKDWYLERLSMILEETETPCYAWVLMDNHAHMLLRTGIKPISTVMRRLLTGYAQYFNRRYTRHGQLFQNRYQSILCEEEPYLLELVRYIHLNPRRAGMVKDLRQLRYYKYSGLNFYELLNRVLTKYGLEKEDLKGGRKRSNIVEARTVICFLGVNTLGMSCVEISRELEISPSTVSKLAYRGRELKEDIRDLT